jgi:hypothetical protein
MPPIILAMPTPDPTSENLTQADIDLAPEKVVELNEHPSSTPSKLNE